ncbi:secreted RxLR effector protein 161-like [Silene latifolia]|uniref:secreted RxLR effector protein 161-like n=1 Tax=Silene latifolia TaxID=37657 RepID=UPI003D784E29
MMNAMLDRLQHNGNDCVIICLYVDDMLIFGTNMDVVNITKNFLHSRLDMKDLGEADIILGIKVTRTPTGNSVSQEEYAKIIGSVMFLMNCTRPDIAYTVSRLSRYTHNPGKDHWNALIRLLRYLKGTMDWGLHYSRTPSVLEGYCDANWVSGNDEIHSTSGYIFTLASGAISWKSCKQTCLAKSTMESEFIALALAGERSLNG